MKKYRNFLLIACFAISFYQSFSQQISITLDGSGAQALGCCNLCGNDYWCVNKPDSCGTSAAADTIFFFDSISSGNRITGISLIYYGASCGAGTVTTFINNIPLVAVTDSANNCICSACDTIISSTFSDSCGVPATQYNYGNWNLLIIAPDSAFCYDRIEVIFSYDSILFLVNPISGPDTVCTGDSVQYSILPVECAVLYEWFIPSGWTIVSGQGTNSVTVISDTTDGLLSVRMISSAGDTGFSAMSVSALAVPGNPGTITGNTSVCFNTTVPYSILPVPGASYYIWYLPSSWNIISGDSTDNISVNVGNSSGNVCVRAANSCGTSAQSCISVTKTNIPTMPGSISGQTSLCSNNSATYSINSVFGATTYLWTVPAGSVITAGQGTTAINNTYGTSGGVICVSAGNFCGYSNPQCLSVNILNPPPDPFAILGPATLCAGSNAVYTIAVGTDGATWSWSVPAGTNINYGQGNDTLYVTFGTTSGNISVIGSNVCGSTSPVSLFVNVIDLSADLSIVNIPCYGQCTGSATVVVTGGGAPYTYLWNPSGQTGSTATGLCAGTHSYSVWDNNGCNLAESFTITQPPVLVVSPPNDDTICEEQFTGLTVSATGGTTPYSFTWAPADGLSATTGPAVIAGPDATTQYTILAIDANSCFDTAIVTVFVDSCSGIDFRFLSNRWSVFPNPSIGKVIIESAYPVAEYFSIQIFGITGIRFLVENDHGMGSRVRKTIDLSELPRGIYLLKITSSLRTDLFKLIKE
ncbi:MAG: T9SS type A sorting domain-containing protein [Bacteroidetes bacterium]|nr:T9SS type A sorting domain-containing protein [Bacteroidota bacterium]